MLYTIKSWGGYDEHLLDVIDNGQVIESTGGSWDLIEYGGTIYYLAKGNSGASSGTWGSMKHFEKHRREALEEAVNRYRNQTGRNKQC